jgi:hypothetical protein
MGGVIRFGEGNLTISGRKFKILEMPVRVDTTIITNCNHTDTMKAVWRIKLKEPRLGGNKEMTFYRE